MKAEPTGLTAGKRERNPKKMRCTKGKSKCINNITLIYGFNMIVRFRVYMAFLMLALAASFAACHSASSSGAPHVIISTGAGDIEVELYPKQAPKTAGAFLSYIDSGFYKNGSFYRVLNDDNQVTGA